MTTRAIQPVEKHKSRSESYGFGVSVSCQRNAAGYFVIRWTENGKRHSTKRKEFADAHELARGLASALSEPRSHLRAVSSHSSALTIVDDYLASPAFRSLADGTQKERKSFVRRRFAPIAVQHSAAHWARAVDETIEVEKADGLKASTIKKDFSVLRAIGSWAIQEGLLHPEATLYKAVRPKATRRDLDDLPTPAEIRKVAGALESRYDPLIVKIAAYCGPRIGELLALTADDFDLDESAITISKQIGSDNRPRAHTKNKQVRRIWWPEALDKDIAELVRQTRKARGAKGRVFPYNRHEWEHAFSRARLSAGWTRSDGKFRWTFHDLRHFFCTWALSPEGWGLEVADVSRLAGHHSPEFTYRTYVRSRPGLGARVRAAGKRWRI